MNKLLLTTLFCSIFLLTACGGGGSSDGNDSSGESAGGGDDNNGGGNDNNGGGDDNNGGGDDNNGGGDDNNGGGDDNNGGGDDNNGGGDDNNGGGDDNNGGANSVNGVNPATTLNIQDNFSYTVLGKNITTSLKSGFNGDVQINRQTYSNGGSTIVSHNITLSNDTPSLNIVDIQKTETADVSCSNGLRAKGTQNYDYSSGQVVISGTYNGTSRSCTDIFKTPLETTVTADTIENLLESWGGDNTSADYISGTCPSDADDTEADKFDPLKYVCTGEILTNYVITTSNPTKVHKLSILYKLNK